MPLNVEITPLTTAFTREQLDALLSAIEHSGELGRSKIYSQLLRYLVDKGLEGRAPKEIDIALDVLGRDTDFDVSKDSAVRVYVHQLRKKLENFYSKHGKDANYQLVIPKGQYAVAAEKRTRGKSARNSSLPRRDYVIWALAALLALNLVYGVWAGLNQSGSSNLALATPLWQPLVEDDTPLLVVLGDYYIFAELDEIGNIGRMIREFDVNSQVDLENKMLDQPDKARHYRHLDLTYLPEGAAHALNQLLPMLHQSGKPVKIRMVSDLTTQDVRSHHVVYVGYISGLGQLRSLVFSGSGLRVGEHFDQLVNRASGETYTSSAGLPDSRHAFTDYGLIASLPFTDQNRLLVVSGMRDSGLIQAAQVVSRREAVDGLLSDLNQPQRALEALYEVKGLDRTNFASKRLYAAPIDTSQLWDEDITPLVE